MRTILVGTIIVLAVATATMIHFKFSEPPPPSNIRPTQPVLPPIQVEPQKPAVPELIQEINARNSSVRTLSCEDMNVKIWEGGMRYRLDGSLHYEKDDNFRMRIRSIFGLELDIGSNNELFWFWSRRNKTPGLHWAVYEDYHKTRLKTPFNPVWMRTTFGIDEIDTDVAAILDKENHYVIVREGQNAIGKDILHAIFVDKREKRIMSTLITDTSGVPLASCEIIEAENGLPVKVLYRWHEEDRTLLLELKKPEINRTLQPRHWSLPDIQPQINMGVE